MAAGEIDELMELWVLSMSEHGGHSPFESYEEMYATIDATKLGDAPWQCFSATYEGLVTNASPSWQLAGYEVWYCDPDTVISNILENPDFEGQFDYSAYVELDKTDGRRWSNFMSANFAWCHSVCALIHVYYLCSS